MDFLLLAGGLPGGLAREIRLDGCDSDFSIFGFETQILNESMGLPGGLQRVHDPGSASGFSRERHSNFHPPNHFSMRLE